MKLSKTARFSLRSLLAAATLGVGIQSAKGATINYYIDQVNNGGTITHFDSSRYLVNVQAVLPDGGYAWMYQSQPNTNLTVDDTFGSATTTPLGYVQNGSINFNNTRNSQVVSSYTDVYADLVIYQDPDAVRRATIYGTVDVIYGPADEWHDVYNYNVAVGTYDGAIRSYNIVNAATYDANLTLNNTVINADSGREAIYTDRGINSSLYLSGVSRINGATLVDQIYGYDGSSTTFNGRVFGATTLGYDTSITYTSQANLIEGGIYGNGGQYSGEGAATVNFNGGNTVNGDIILQSGGNIPGGPGACSINVKGLGVVFNGGPGDNFYSGGAPFFFPQYVNVTAEYLNILNGSSLTLGNDLTAVIGDVNFTGNSRLDIGDNVTLLAAYNGVLAGTGSSTINFNGSATIETLQFMLFGHEYNGEGIGGTGAFTEINVNGDSDSTARLYGATKAIAVNMKSNGTLVLGGGLNSLYQDGETLGTLKFANNNAEVQIGAEGFYYDNVIELRTNISTDTNNNGKLKFLGGLVNVYGSVASATKELASVDVGGTGSGTGDDTISGSKPITYTEVHFNTDVFAHNVGLNGGYATLVMESGYNLKGTVLTSSASEFSRLYLAGGTQVADFASVGGNGGTGASKMITVIDSGMVSGDASTFTGNVFAEHLNTYDGITNFQKGVTVTNATIRSGTTNFNVAVGTTPSTGATNISDRLTFTGTGTANFYQGVTLTSGTNPGAINFDGYAATVNISAGKDLNGNVLNTDLISGAADGTVNFLGGTSALNGYVGTGTGNQSIGLLHVGVDSQADLTVSGNIYSIETRLSNNSTLTARGDITGDVTNSSTVAAGTLNLVESYSQSVNGTIGSSTAALHMVEAGAAGSTTYLNGMVYANTVKYNGNGTIELNGTNGGDPVGGVLGTVDFNGYDGDLNIGDNVNLTFGTTASSFANANNATLTFLGSSTVNGNVGGAWTGTNPAGSTIRDIYAGATGERVTFNGKVYVSETTFHVTGLGTVDFNDDLVGPLNFQDDGVVNFAHTKGIVGITPGNGTATTNYDGEGTINFLGSTTQDGEIGFFDPFTPVYGRLNTVNFHSGTTAANVIQNLNYSVYSWYTNIGNTSTIGTTPTTTTAIIGRNPSSSDNIHLGTDVAMADASTSLFTAGTQYLTLNGGPLDDTYVDFVHRKNADGTLTLGTVASPVAITQSRFDANLTTHDGTLGFAISAEPYTSSTAPGVYNGVVATDSSLSSSINGEGYGVENNYYGSYLNMSDEEKVQVAFLGSMKDNVSYTLIDVVNNDGGMGTGPMPYTLLDNSFTIDTTLSRSNSDADLVITTHRDEYTYLDKSGTRLLGLRSYDMAHRLGSLAAAGTGYSAGLQVVFNKLDLDQWGYGNNEENLARQLYLLTPSGDGAAVKAGTGLTAQAVGAVLDGSNSLSTRATPQRSYWVRAFGGHQNQSASGEYAGYNINGGGLAVGTDYAIGDSVVGVALGYGQATANSSGLRDGDKAKVDSTIAGLFFRTPIGEYFLNAMIDGAKHRTKTERQTAVGERANGDYTGTEIGGAIQLGRKFVLSDKNSSLTPILSVNYGRYKQEAYAETGAGDIGLNYAEQKYSQTDAMISLRYAVETILGEGMASSFSASLGYKHLLSNPTYNNTVNFVGDTNTFDVAGFKETHKGSVTASLAYNYNPSKGVTYTIDYNGEVKSGYNAHSLGFRATWEY